MINYNSLSQVPLFPKSINLELTNHCNLECIMCTNPKSEFRKKGFMNKEVINKIIREVVANKKYISNGVIICGIGEPLLHDEAVNVIEKLKFNGIKVMLNTNGVILDENISEQLLKCNIDRIMISLDATNKEMYKKIKGRDFYNKVLDNIFILLNTKKKLSSRTQIQINMLRMTENFQEIEEAIKFWSDALGNGDIIYSREVKTLANQVDDFRVVNDNLRDIDYDYNKSLTAFKQHLKSKGTDISKYVVEDWTKVLNINNKSDTKVICRHLWNYTMILFNGDVSACCIDFNGQLIMGNIKQSNIVEIWKGSKYQEMRNMFLNQKYNSISLCKNCNEWYKCL